MSNQYLNTKPTTNNQEDDPASFEGGAAEGAEVQQTPPKRGRPPVVGIDKYKGQAAEAYPESPLRRKQ